MAQYDIDGALIQLPDQTVFVPESVSTGEIYMGGATPSDITIPANSLWLVSGLAVTASDSNYWTFAIGHSPPSGPTAIALSVTTKTTGSGGTGDLVAGVRKTLTHAAFFVPKGSIFAAVATKTGTPAAPAMLFGFPLTQ